MLNKLRRRFASRRHRNLHNTSSQLSSGSSSRRSKALALESLEPRHLLTGGLTLGADQAITLHAGEPLQLPINAVDTGGNPVSYSVSSTNPNITPLLPTTNPDLVLNISYSGNGTASDPAFSGQVIIELFQDRVPNTVAQIVSLTNQGFYNGVLFHRVSEGFVNQAGKPTQQDINNHITVPTIDDEFNQSLRFTSAGDFGMARSSHDTDSSEFFVTLAAADNSLDYQYTMFGHVVSDPNGVMAKINAVPHDSSFGSASDGTPLSPVTITSATIIQDTNNLALQVSAPETLAAGATGDVMVTATDGHGGTATQTFHVTTAADTFDPPPFLNPVPTPSTTINTPNTFQLSAFDLKGDPLAFYGPSQLSSTFHLNPTQPLNPNLDISVNQSSGLVTVTPKNGIVGVVPMFFGVSASPPTASADTQMVPLFINPAAPNSISLEVGSDTGLSSSDNITSLNNSAGHTLKFDVTGLMSPGSTILLFAGSQQIGSATYTGSTTTTATVVVTTDGSHVLSDGQQHIAAEQILPTQSNPVGNSSATFTPTSALSNEINVTVDTAAPTVTNVSTPAAANSTFNVGQSLNIVIAFSQPVFVTGTPRLALNDTASVKFASGSGTTALTFVYTVAPGQNTTDLDYSSTAALTLNGGTISDAAGNAAVLTLPAIGTDDLAVKNITITSPPGAPDLAVTITPSAATAMAGGSIVYTVTVTNSGTVDAVGVIVADALPASVSFGSQVQSSGPSFALAHTGNVISDTIDTLAAGASATLKIVADVGASVVGGKVITDTVTISSSSTESNTDNNTASANVTIVSTGVALAVDPFDSTKMELVADGTAGNDNISFLPVAGGKVSVNMNGRMFGPFAVTSRLVAMGGAGNDVISVSPSITLPAFLYAGTGIDRLTGGGGPNVLVGGGGTVTMIGGPTRNVLIAGAGKATIYSSKLGAAVGANSGSLMIAGATNFDQNDSALSAIMHEWGSSDIYATRISKIRNGQIGAGVTMNASTVHPTAHVVDQLYASPGGYDWFLNFGLTSQMLGIDPHKKSLIQIN